MTFHSTNAYQDQGQSQGQGSGQMDSSPGVDSGGRGSGVRTTPTALFDESSISVGERVGTDDFPSGDRGDLHFYLAFSIIESFLC